MGEGALRRDWRLTPDATARFASFGRIELIAMILRLEERIARVREAEGDG